MSEIFEEQKQILELRSRVLYAEQERISGAKTLSVIEARENMRERYDEEKSLDEADRQATMIDTRLSHVTIFGNAKKAVALGYSASDLTQNRNKIEET